MRIRTLILLSVFALVVAACDGAVEDTTSSAAGGTSTTTESTVEAVQLSYALEAGTTYEYEVDMNQTIDLTTSGDTTTLGEEEDLPASMSITMTGTTSLTYAVADGPEEGTYEITITGDFSDLDFEGTIDGESVDSSEIPDMAEMDPVDVTVVVDEQGNVIPDDSVGLGEDFLGGFGGFEMFEQFGGAGTVGQFIGPPLTEDEVSVGGTWSETTEIPVMPEADPVSITIDSEIVGTDDVEGNEVFVIETTSTTSAFEFDLAELLAGFMTAFIPDDASEDERAEIDAIVEQVRFGFSIDESVSDMTTWFDHEAGVTRRAEIAGETHMVMDINVPDDATGELVEFAMDMTIGQDLTYRLVGSNDA